MDWVKIKVKHVLFSDLEPAQIGTLVSLQALTAAIERIPTRKEMTKHVHHRQLKSLEDALERIAKESQDLVKDDSYDVQELVKDSSRNLQDILKKVLRDVREVHDKRVKNNERKRRSRSKDENVTRDIIATSRGCPIREEKRREDIKEQQAAPKEPAAAAFSETKIPEENQEDDLNQIIDRIVEIRSETSRKNGRPVKSPMTLKQKLKDAYNNNSDELIAWKEQIAFDDDQKKKQADKQRAAEEEAKRKQEEAEQEEEKNIEINCYMEVYDKLPKREKDELWGTAQEIESRSIPSGLKPFVPIVKRRVIRLMREQGFVDENVMQKRIKEVVLWQKQQKKNQE